MVGARGADSDLCRRYTGQAARGKQRASLLDDESGVAAPRSLPEWDRGRAVYECARQTPTSIPLARMGGLMSTLVIVASCIAIVVSIMWTVYRFGHMRGYVKGYKEGADYAIKGYDAMVKETLNQKYDAWNPFASKDLN
jgi:hypothetical protein